MVHTFLRHGVNVHYRIGSLERSNEVCQLSYFVHYRIGSLETESHDTAGGKMVHYRIGSLEKKLGWRISEPGCSLPYR